MQQIEGLAAVDLPLAHQAGGVASDASRREAVRSPRVPSEPGGIGLDTGSTGKLLPVGIPPIGPMGIGPGACRHSAEPTEGSHGELHQQTFHTDKRRDVSNFMAELPTRSNDSTASEDRQLHQPIAKEWRM